VEEYIPFILWGLVVGAAMFFGSAIVLLVVIVLLPVDFLNRTGPPLAKLRARSVFAWAAVLALKNLIALTLVILGIIMLVAPGQGLLSLLVGVLFSDVPGKRRLIRRLMETRGIFKLMNKIRAKANRPPLEPHRD